MEENSKHSVGTSQVLLKFFHAQIEVATEDSQGKAAHILKHSLRSLDQATTTFGVAEGKTVVTCTNKQLWRSKSFLLL